MKAKSRELKNEKDLIIKIVLIIIIILLLIHNCGMSLNNRNQNNVPVIPNGNMDIIEIKCNDNKCKDDDKNTENKGSKPSQKVIKEIESLSFEQTSINITRGNTLNLTVIIKPVEFSGSILAWKSDNSNIVTVDANGMITGISNGTATITVTSANGKKATCVVTVVDDIIPVSSLEISPTKLEVGVGLKKQVTATIKPDNATNRELVWTTNDSSIAKVDSNGVITGVGVGTTKIIVKTKDGRIVKEITVEVDNDDGSDTLKVYDKDYNPVTWNGTDELKIFTRSIYNVDGIIAPESSNTYQFVVKNSTEYSIKYNIDFIETNNYNINMKYKLKKNDTYLIDHYVSYDELIVNNQLLSVNNKDVYYLEWKWISSDNDTLIGQNPDAEYGLRIEVKAESVNE